MNKKYILLIFLIILFIIDAILVVSSNIIWFDTTIYNAVRSINNSFFDKYFTFITSFANAKTILIVLAILNIKLPRKDAIMCDILTIVSVCTNTILKYIFIRERPDVLRLIKQGGYSFPSGHSMVSVMLYGYLLYLVRNKIKDKKLKIVLEILLGMLILSICASRIYVGVHYASDVFGGIVIGLALLILIILLDKKYSGGEKGV